MSIGLRLLVLACSAAAIWSLADIAYIAIYRDMSKISRYSIAILSIFIEQLFINNHTIFMQVEAALLWWRHKNKHIKCYMAREGELGLGVGGGEGIKGGRGEGRGGEGGRGRGEGGGGRGGGGRGGGGRGEGGKRHCTNWYTYTAVYMNRVLPK